MTSETAFCAQYNAQSSRSCRAQKDGLLTVVLVGWTLEVWQRMGSNLELRNHSLKLGHSSSQKSLQTSQNVDEKQLQPLQLGALRWRAEQCCKSLSEARWAGAHTTHRLVCQASSFYIALSLEILGSNPEPGNSN